MHTCDVPAAAAAIRPMKFIRSSVLVESLWMYGTNSMEWNSTNRALLRHVPEETTYRHWGYLRLHSILSLVDGHLNTVLINGFFSLRAFGKETFLYGLRFCRDVLGDGSGIGLLVRLRTQRGHN